MSGEIAKKRRCEQDFVDPATSVDLCLKLLRGQRGCDVIFVVGREKKKIGAHMIILKERSSFFEALFTERGTSKVTNGVHEIVVKEFELTIVRSFLEHIYGYVFRANPVEAVQLLYLANYYEIKSLVKASVELLAKPFHLDDLLPVYATAKKFQLSDVMIKAGKSMANYFTQLSNLPTFETADEAVLMDLLKRDDLNVEEYVLFSSLVRWADKQIMDSSQDLKINSWRAFFLKNLIPLVRFPTMSARKFAEVVAVENILPVETERDLLLYLLLRNNEESWCNARKAIADRLPFCSFPRNSDMVSIEFYKQESRPGTGAYPSVALTKCSSVVDILQLKYRRFTGTPPRNVQIVSLVLERPRGALPPFQNGSEVKLMPIRVAISLSEPDTVDSQLIWTSEEVITNIGERTVVLTLDIPWVLSIHKLYKITTRFLTDVYTVPVGVVGDGSPENPMSRRDENYDFFTGTRLRHEILVNRKNISLRGLSMRGSYGSTADASAAQGTSLSSGLHLIRSIQVTDL